MDMSSETLSYPPKMVPMPKDLPDPTFWQKLFPDSLSCRLYVLTVVIETIIDLVIEGELLLRYRAGLHNDASQKMKTYLSIFAIAHVFQLFMALDAVWARNTLQFICLTIFNFLFLIYAVIQIGEIRATLGDGTTGLVDIPVHVLTTIIPCVIGIAEMAFIALGWKIYTEFGWKVYKFLGADRRLRKMYGNYQIFQCLIKFDVFFWVGFSVQFIIIILDRADWEFYVTCAALPLSLVLLVEGHLGARHENKMLMYTFMMGCGAGLVYFVYKLVRVIKAKDNTDTDDPYPLIWKSLTTFSVIAILLLLVTFVFAIMVLKAFDRGLKAALEKSEATQVRIGATAAHNRAASANLINRMSIE